MILLCGCYHIYLQSKGFFCLKSWSHQHSSLPTITQRQFCFLGLWKMDCTYFQLFSMFIQLPFLSALLMKCAGGWTTQRQKHWQERQIKLFALKCSLKRYLRESCISVLFLKRKASHLSNLKWACCPSYPSWRLFSRQPRERWMVCLIGHRKGAPRLKVRVVGWLFLSAHGLFYPT